MSLWVVVGGQYGSEGKGKISAYITQSEGIDICIRCGGPNSGHSFVAADGTPHVVRQLPTGFIRPETRLLIPAGALIDVRILEAELKTLALDANRVGIDRNAMVIEESDKQAEASMHLQQRLSSTLCGVGSAVSRRALRGVGVRLACDAAAGSHRWLGEFLTDASAEANNTIDAGGSVLVEGTQGFGLSLYHSYEYPKSTSRDTTASAFLSEVGLSPGLVSEIVVVLRTFPIRVAGLQAGGMNDETTWELVQRESGYPFPIEERTTVTQKIRRVARFDWELARRAVLVNRPTRIALNFLDYIDFANRAAREWSVITQGAKEFVYEVECRLGRVAYCGTGAGVLDVAIPLYDATTQIRKTSANDLQTTKIVERR